MYYSGEFYVINMSPDLNKRRTRSHVGVRETEDTIDDGSCAKIIDVNDRGDDIPRTSNGLRAKVRELWLEGQVKGKPGAKKYRKRPGGRRRSRLREYLQSEPED